MEIQFITDAQGKKTAAIVPFDEWERTEAAKEILEHVYLDGIIKERKNKKPTVNLDDLLTADRLTIVTDAEEGSEKTDFGHIAIVPLWKWLLEENK